MKNKKNIIWILLTVVLLVLIYFIYTKVIAKDEADDFSSVSSASSNIGVLGQEFIYLVNKIRDIRIDIDFFNSAQFKKLKDFEPVFEYPKDVGRKDPFASFEQTQVKELED